MPFFAAIIIQANLPLQNAHFKNRLHTHAFFFFLIRDVDLCTRDRLRFSIFKNSKTAYKIEQLNRPMGPVRASINYPRLLLNKLNITRQIIAQLYILRGEFASIRPNIPPTHRRIQMLISLPNYVHNTSGNCRRVF